MAGYDFSQISDEQLEATVDALMHDPIALRSTPVAQRQATIDEYNRRNAARGAKPAAVATAPAPVAPNVEANLEASAAPIAPDPVVGSRKAPAPQSYGDYAEQSDLYQRGIGLEPQDGYETDAEVEARFDAKFGRGAYKKHKEQTRLRDGGREYRAGIKAHLDARDAENQAARRAGYQDPEQIAYNEATGVVYGRPAAGPMQGPSPMDPNDPSTWEAGYEDYVRRSTPAEPTNSVERVDRHIAWMRNPERFQIQPKDEWMADRHQEYVRRQAAKDRETYGWGMPEDQLTDQQRANRRTQVEGEGRVRANRLDTIINRIASSTGAPRAAVRAAFATAGEDGKDPLADGILTPQEIARASQPFRDAAGDKRDAELAERRAFLRRRGMMAGSNLRANAANNWTDMPADWQNFVRAGGKGATPLDVEAAHNAQLTALGLRAVTGKGFADPTPEQKRMIEQQLREGDPVGAGVTDINARNYESPHAQTELGRLAQSLDTTTAGYSYDDERKLANALMQPPYNMPQADAEAYAYRYAEKRRWLSGGKPYGAGTPQPAPKPDVQGIAPGSVPAV